MSAETRAALLYSQIQDGFMESPAVSGATDYKQLCLAARSEEKRLAELEKRRRFLKQTAVAPQPTTPITNSGTENPPPTYGVDSAPGSRCCFKCGTPSHLARECRASRTENGGGGRRWGRDDNRTEINNR